MILEEDDEVEMRTKTGEEIDDMNEREEMMES